MNRQDFQRLAMTRLREAEVLLAAVPSCPDGAYYLAGYAVECGLKACVVARIGREPELVFSRRRFSDDCFTHSLLDLMVTAGLGDVLDKAVAANPLLKQNWQTAQEWKEDSRYKFWPFAKADALVRAVGDQQDGVLMWVKQHW